MNFRGREIDVVALWGHYCDKIEDGKGPFLPLTYCPNPNHDNSRSPAFQVNVYKPLVHCFSSCGVSGSYEHAVALIEGFYDECKVTQKDINIAKTKKQRNEPPEIQAARARVFKAKRKAEKQILQLALKKGGVASVQRGSRKIQERKLSLSRANGAEVGGVLDERELLNYSYLGKDAIRYLTYRGIDDTARSLWRLGYDEEQERITIPVFDERKRLRFIIKRGIRKNQRPKYLNPSDSVAKSLLFGSCNLDYDLVHSDGLIVVEGPLDCIKLHQHGFRNTVAILGSTISDKQRQLIAKLRPKRIILFLDRDAAGAGGLLKASLLLNRYQIKVPLYPKGKFDPATLTAEECKRVIGKAISILALKKRLARASVRW